MSKRPVTSVVKDSRPDSQARPGPSSATRRARTSIRFGGHLHHFQMTAAIRIHSSALAAHPCADECRCSGVSPGG
ncbi:hypothetical protein HYQ46_001589 [Verticillium longisporum]|nr:hypothetical protein HYQ46_001589 [Verticillium longisporum]